MAPSPHRLRVRTDRVREVAWKRQAVPETGGRFPTLLHDVAWSREETVVLVHLRDRYRVATAAGEDRVLTAAVIDGRPASVGRDVAAQRGDFDDLAIADGSDGAMVYTGRNGLDPGALEPADNFLRSYAGREVDVTDRKAKQIVANRPANETGHAVGRTQCVEQARHAPTFPPFLRIQFHGHRSRRDRFTSIAAVAPHILRFCHAIS